MQKLLFLSSILATALSISAQTPVAAGFTYRVATGATSRGPQGAGAAQLLFRFDSEDYRSYGDAQAAGNQVLGCQITLQDQYALTGSQERYDLRLYGEDPAHANYPNFLPNQPVGTNELVRMGPYTSLVAGTASDPRGAWLIAIAFATPITLPAGQDIFVGVEFQASAAANPNTTPAGWPNDGLSMHTSLGAAGISQTYDSRGPGAIAGGTTANSYMLVHDVGNNVYAYSSGMHQGQVDFLVPGTIGRGVITAITNQTSYPISNASPGTASFFSALHPDARSTPTNSGRADTVGYSFLGASAGSLVFYMVDFGFGSSPVPLSNFQASSTGMACLNLASAMTLGFNVANGSGVDFYPFALSPSARSLIAGVTVAMQGISFDPATGILRSGPCGAVKF
jgi:hypothetical protein